MVFQSIKRSQQLSLCRAELVKTTRTSIIYSVDCFSQFDHSGILGSDRKQNSARGAAKVSINSH